MLLDVVTDILEVLLHRLGNGYFHLRDAECLHQRCGIVVRAVCRSETRHGDAHNALTVKSHLVEGTNADQQREC